jgi:hypothetical protein
LHIVIAGYTEHADISFVQAFDAIGQHPVGLKEIVLSLDYVTGQGYGVDITLYSRIHGA